MSQKVCASLEVVDGSIGLFDLNNYYRPALTEISFAPCPPENLSRYYKQSVMIILELNGESAEPKMKRLSTDVHLAALQFHQRYISEVRIPASGSINFHSMIVILEGHRDLKCKDQYLEVLVYEDADVLQQIKLTVRFL